MVPEALSWERPLAGRSAIPCVTSHKSSLNTRTWAFKRHTAKWSYQLTLQAPLCWPSHLSAGNLNKFTNWDGRTHPSNTRMVFFYSLSTWSTAVQLCSLESSDCCAPVSCEGLASKPIHTKRRKKLEPCINTFIENCDHFLQKTEPQFRTGWPGPVRQHKSSVKVCTELYSSDLK